MIITSADGAQVELLVGADPEIFAKRGNTLVSAHEMVKGTKEVPHPVKGGAIQVDGMALEFNIDPAHSMQQFVNNINDVMNELTDAIPAGVELAIVPTAEFGAQYIQSQPDIAKELGCSPDFNAYLDGAENIKPDENMPFRTASGHLHIGWTGDMPSTDPNHRQDCIALTKVLDLYLGVPSVLMDPDTKRRSLYGQAGAFRYKPYGVEYRVLSNFWLLNNSKVQWAYNAVKDGVTAFLNGFRSEGEQAKEVENVINNSDTSEAEKLVSRFNLTTA